MTALGDAARALGDQVDQVLAARDAQDGEERAAWAAERGALLGRIADLEARTPTPPAGRKLIVGVNCNGASGATDEERVVQFGRLPMSRQYNLEVPVAQWGPEKRAQLSAKPNLADFNAGRLDAWYVDTIAGHLDDGAVLLLATLWHEPNGEISKGQLSIGDLHAAWKRQAKLHADHLDHRVLVAPNFTAPQRRTGVAWNDAWMLTPDQLGGVERARWCWDNYLNPARAKDYGGDPYATPYPAPGEVADQMIATTKALGWAESVGITEFNSPRRTTKTPPDVEEYERVACLEAYVLYVLERLPNLAHLLLWEAARGVQFDQSFKRRRSFDWFGRWIARSA